MNTVFLASVNLNFYWGNAGYSYHFNGQENDDEMYGDGNSTTAEFWQYDSRLGRRWNPDPVITHEISRYSVLHNSPIVLVDPKGNTDYYNTQGQYIGTDGSDNGQSKIVLKASTEKIIRDATVTGSNISMNENYYTDIVDVPSAAFIAASETAIKNTNTPNVDRGGTDETNAGHEDGFVSGTNNATGQEQITTVPAQDAVTNLPGGNTADVPSINFNNTVALQEQTASVDLIVHTHTQNTIALDPIDIQVGDEIVHIEGQSIGWGNGGEYSGPSEGDKTAIKGYPGTMGVVIGSVDRMVTYFNSEGVQGSVDLDTVKELRRNIDNGTAKNQDSCEH